MIALQIRFLAGRYHATGWHSAHNEAVPEWPPSPWRVLRSLVSAAYAAEAPQAQVVSLLGKLRGLPKYHVPRAVDAHTRHYVPDTDDGNHKKAKLFDAFVAVEGGAREPQPLTMSWDAELAPSERELLADLCRRVSFLGRAESWAELSVVDGFPEWNCVPDEQSGASNATSLLALSSASELEAWAKEQPKPKKGSDVPRGLWDVLTFSGERYRDEGWSTVPGTQLARYVFKRSPFLRAPAPTASRRPATLPTVARYAIRSAVLPKLEEALWIAERLRKSAMAQSREVDGNAKPVFSGHDVGGGHLHAMYLATSEDPRNRGFIDHLTIRAKGGFDEQDVMALQRLRWLWGKGGHDLELILVGLGQPSDFGGDALPRSRLLARSRVWESVTPFVPTRHPKTVRGVDRDGIQDQIRRGCEQLLGVAPELVESFSGPIDWRRFRRRRQEGGGNRGPDRAYGARLTFAEPVEGPIALGYGAHFGLGLFCSVGRRTKAESDRATEA